MKRTKKQIYCQKCGNVADWYKKGKRYRVLVCPRCGIIAHNPIPWSAIGSAVGSIVPGGSIVGGLVGSALEGASAQKETSHHAEGQKVVYRDANKLSRNDLVIERFLGEDK